MAQNRLKIQRILIEAHTRKNFTPEYLVAMFEEKDSDDEAWEKLFITLTGGTEEVSLQGLTDHLN